MAASVRQMMLSRSRASLTAARPMTPRNSAPGWRFAHRDAQDKDSMNTEPNEYSKSGSDSQAAQTDAAFDASKTRPEDIKKGKDSPMNESPANQEFSKPKAATSPKTEGSASEDGKASESSRARTSGGGSPNKQGEGGN